MVSLGFRVPRVITNTHLLAEIIFSFIIDVPRLANYGFRAAHNAISDVNVTRSPIKLFLTRGIIQLDERELQLIPSLDRHSVI